MVDSYVWLEWRNQFHSWAIFTTDYYRRDGSTFVRHTAHSHRAQKENYRIFVSILFA